MDFRKVKVDQSAITDISQELREGRLTSGPFVEQVEAKMKQLMVAEYAVAVSSCTMALKITLDAFGVGKDDYVIVPDLTFIACASVVMELGAKPLFVEVDPDTMTMDFEDVARTLLAHKDKVKAIIAVKLGGEPVDSRMFAFDIPVVIDSAHSMDPAHPLAAATCYSFHPSKIVSGIEGGVIVTNLVKLDEQARKLRLFGFEPGTRIASQLGYKGNMSNISACLIAFNLGHLGANLGARRLFRDIYNASFGLSRKGLGMYMVYVEDPDALCARLPACIRHYPMTLSKMIGGEGINPKAQWMADHLVSIPMHEHLSDTEVGEVCAIIKPLVINYSDHGPKESIAV